MIWNEKVNEKCLVSIVMLSKNKAQFVEESVRSVMVQTVRRENMNLYHFGVVEQS